jgi:hypothetical protein
VVDFGGRALTQVSGEVNRKLRELRHMGNRKTARVRKTERARCALAGIGIAVFGNVAPGVLERHEKAVLG